MRTRHGLEALLLLVFLALLLLPRFVLARNPVGPNTVFDTPLPVLIASLVAESGNEALALAVVAIESATLAVALLLARYIWRFVGTEEVGGR
jgi:hypothetical protein